ncbi:MAG: YceI family protein [Acidobacteria bacterium]|nr:YceI family protein [Acidobacteriota bacterium]
MARSLSLSRIPAALALAAAATLVPASAAAESLKIDSDHSTVAFKVSHLVFSKVLGRFDRFEGTLTLDPADLTKSAATVTIDAASIDTNEPDRDKHLKSDAFFDVEKFPKVTFQSTAVRKTAGDKYEMDGNLTMRGVTKPVTLKVDVIGVGADRGGLRAGFEASTRVNRKDYGVSWNNVVEGGGVVVGDDVDIMLTIEAFRPGAKK